MELNRVCSGLAAEKHGSLVHSIGWDGVEGDCNDDVETEQHGSLEVVGFTILNCVCNNQDRNGESDGFD
jgi:hypothetical protein